MWSCSETDLSGRHGDEVGHGLHFASHTTSLSTVSTVCLRRPLTQGTLLQPAATSLANNAAGVRTQQGLVPEDRAARVGGKD